MKWFVGTLLLGCTLIVGLNYWADPSQRGHRKAALISREIKPGEVYIRPREGDERLMKFSYIKRATFTPDWVVLGSSRGILVDEQMFRAGLRSSDLRSMNLGVSGGSVEDYLAFWEILVEEKKVPKNLMIVVDPWIFNKNNEQGRWRTLSTYHDHFMRRVGESSSSLVAKYQSFGGELADRWFQAKDLMSYQTFKASLKFSKRWFDRRSEKALSWEGTIVREAQMPADESAIRWDGSHVYSAQVSAPRALRLVEEKAAQYGDDPLVYSLNQWVYDTQAVQSFKLLIQDALKQGGKVFLIAPPYQPLAMKKLLLRKGFADIFSLYLATLQEIAQNSEGGVQFCDAMDSRAMGCDDADFMDGMHPWRGCTASFISKCLQ